MDFSEVAARESSGLAQRIEREIADVTARLADAALAEREEAVRSVTDEARAIADGLRAELAEQIAENASTRAALAEARGEIESTRDLLAERTALHESTELALTEAQSQIDSAQAMLAERVALHQASERALQEAHADAASLRADLAERVALHEAAETALADARGRAEATAATLNERIARHEATESALNDIRRQLESVRGTLAAKTAEQAETARVLADARGQIESLRASLENVEGLLATARTDLIEARRAIDQHDAAARASSAARDQAVRERDSETTARVAVETELEELRAMLADHERARVDIEARMEALAERDGVAASLLEAALSAFSTLSTAATIPDVLTTLVEQLAAEFPRVALFRPKANRLEGQHQIGFDLSNDITKVVMPLTLDSLPTRAAASGRIEAMPDGGASENVPFGGTPACAVALPLVVQGETLAVVYVDDFGSERQDTAAERLSRVKYCEVMQQHAAALLMRLTNELKALAELRAYAGSLVSEIEQMYVADVGTGRSGDDLRQRLQANVEYARSIFGSRVALECPDAAGLLDDAFAAALDSETGGGFCRDLRSISSTPAAADRKRA